jgi:NAD(P)H dehydrogenase (quinone)
MKSHPHHRTALVVVSHPDAASFNHAIARDSAAMLETLGFTTHLCDLYADSFDPVITKGEVRGQRTGDQLTNMYISLLASAELLVVVHPNCWGAPPAMMKVGWIGCLLKARHMLLKNLVTKAMCQEDCCE